MPLVRLNAEGKTCHKIEAGQILGLPGGPEMAIQEISYEGEAQPECETEREP
ncbi:hypothetical protein CLE01_31500 [Cryobacterium levicorallinum]|nr:hypothetical protein CLE01_31500 [Cryobacterium levicorallinum]